MAKTVDPMLRSMQAGIAAWLVPGAGHFVLGLRPLAYAYFGAISFAYLAGVLIGGAKTSIDPVGNFWLFLAELGCGAYTGIFYLVARAIPSVYPWQPSAYVSYYPEADVAQIYLAVAGLLNVLAILDALARAQTGGLPVFHHELAMKERARAQAEAAAAPAVPPASSEAGA